MEVRDAAIYNIAIWTMLPTKSQGRLGSTTTSLRFKQNIKCDKIQLTIIQLSNPVNILHYVIVKKFDQQVHYCPQYKI